MNTQDLSLRFADLQSDGYKFDCQLIPGDIQVLQILIEGVEEIPIYLSCTEHQILCIAYLWTETEVKPEKRSDMLEAMLEMNIPMPLSAFAKVEDKYVVFGAMSVNAAFEEIVHEVITLSENSVEVLATMSEFLT